MDNEQLISFGGEVKHLGGGKIRGAAVVFTPVGKEMDLEGEFFTAESDLGRQKEFPLYMSHGLDPLLGTIPIGFGKIEKDDIAAWFEGQLEIAAEYEKDVGGVKRKKRIEKALIDLVESGKMGMSTQPIQTSVRKEARDGGVWLKRWHIAENSLTGRPAEPGTKGVQLFKSFEVGESAVDISDDAPTTNINVTVNLPGSGTNEAPMEDETKVTEPVAKSEPEAKAEAKSDDTQLRKELADIKETLKAFTAKTSRAEFDVSGAPAFNKRRGGDTQDAAVDHWLRTGEKIGGLNLKAAGDLEGDTRSFGNAPVLEAKFRTKDWNAAMKASNDDEQNITTTTEGGYLVPTGHFRGIINRMAEVRLAERIGVRQITGKGTTVNTPLGGAFTDFVSTAESATFARHAQIYGQAAFTKVKYTRDVHATYELLEDEDSNFLDDMAQYTGACAGLTHNSLLIAANDIGGTVFAVSAAATAIASGEPEKCVLNANVTDYLDAGAAWIINPVVFRSVATIASSSVFTYSQHPHGMIGNLGNGSGGAQAQLLGYPVWFSSKAASSLAALAHSLHFGAWSFAMGLYEDPTLRVLRDPYSGAAAGEVHFHYYFRAAYKTLQAGAGGYLRQIST